MFCIQCGKQIADDARFCSYCGSPVIRKKICPSCGKEMEPDMVYCSFCGTKIDAAEPGMNSEEKRTVEEVRETPRENGHETVNSDSYHNTYPDTRQDAMTYENPNGLASAKVSWYPGDVKVGIAKASGTLMVFRDRVELKKTIGGSGAMAFGAIGMAVSAVKARKDSNLVFEMNQIANIRESKYGGMYPAMVLEMRSGEKHTFAGALNKQAIQDCIDLIRRYIK